MIEAGLIGFVQVNKREVLLCLEVVVVVDKDRARGGPSRLDAAKRIQSIEG